MNKLNKILIIGLGLLSTLLYYPAMAGNRAGVVTLTPAVGYYVFSNQRQIKNTAIPNAAIAYNFNDKWAIEGTVGIINTQSNTAGLPGTHGTLYLVDGLYRIKPYKIIEPYLTAGVGALNLNNNYNNDALTQANINAGAGAQVFFTDCMAFRGEVRDLYTFVGGKNDVMFNLGLSLLFNTLSS